VGQDPALLDGKDLFYRHTPLMLASKEGHVGVVRWLLDKGAATDEVHLLGSTALWYACSGGRTPVVKLLLERGADPTIADRRGATPLVVASARGHLEVVRVLLSHPTAKASVNLRDASGRTALLLLRPWGGL
jgi:uncharacterized protein